MERESTLTHEKIELNKNLLEGVETYEGKYLLKVPQSVLEICDAVQVHGGRAFVVGGAVRDAVMAVELEGYSDIPKDFDIEVYGLEPAALESLIQQLSCVKHVSPEGKAFCVFKVSVVGSGHPIDVAVARSEKPNPEITRKSIVTGNPGATMREAAKRRDLTIGSLFYDPRQESVYDPYGGVEDIRAQMLHIVNPETFVEDPVRVLRVVQFAARFGFQVSPTTREVCTNMVRDGALDTLPRDPITGEFEKLFSGARSIANGMEVARHFGVLAWYWPEFPSDTADFSPLAEVDEQIAGFPLTVQSKVRIAAAHAALGGRHETLGLFMSRLRVSGREKQAIGAMDSSFSLVLDDSENGPDFIARKASYIAGKGNSTLAEVLAVARSFASDEQRERVQKVEQFAQDHGIIENAFQVYIDGEDVLPYFDGKGGYWVKDILDVALEEHFEGKVNDRTSALESLEKIIFQYKEEHKQVTANTTFYKKRA